jgi:hypothetical protein
VRTLARVATRRLAYVPAERGAGGACRAVIDAFATSASPTSCRRSRSFAIAMRRASKYCRMQFILDKFGDHVIDAIGRQELVAWLDEQGDERDWEAATYNRYKALLSLTFRLAMEEREGSVESGTVGAAPARERRPRALAANGTEGRHVDSEK